MEPRRICGRYLRSLSRYVSKKLGVGQGALVCLAGCTLALPLLFYVHLFLLYGHVIHRTGAAATWSHFSEEPSHPGALPPLPLPDAREDSLFRVLDPVAPANATFFDLKDILEEHEERIQRMRNECARNPESMTGLSSENWAFGRMALETNFRLLYCPLLKAGSTFWRRVLYAMQKEQSMHSPYQIAISTALRTPTPSLLRFLPREEAPRRALLGNLTKFMFVRDPFSRLLSGYVDKLFAPNPYFWTTVGRPIIASFRHNASARSLRCGHDVTFPEFVDYVISSERLMYPHRDAHFTPAYDQCKPCQLEYDVLGKMESFQQDLAFMFARLGFNVSKQLLQQWARQAEDDAIIDSTHSPFGWKKSIVSCMSMLEASKRIWRKLQIRGLIGLEAKLPFSAHQLQSMHRSVFVRRVKKLRQDSPNPGVRLDQKRAALLEALSSITFEKLDQLRKVFTQDFALFGYDSSSADVDQLRSAGRPAVYFNLTDV